MNRRIRKEIEIIRHSLAVIEVVIDEYEQKLANDLYKDETVDELFEELEAMDTTNWSAADEPSKEAVVYLKDLKDFTELKGMVITGQIQTVFDVKSYVKKEGGAGLVYRFVLSDETGGMTAICFDDMATKMKEYTVGQYVRITNAWKVQKNKNGIPEIHLGNFAKVEVIE